jgi:hypothetical protein
MSDSNSADCLAAAPASASVVAAGAENGLPTFQRNVLRKYFRRAAFTPDDVAEIDYQRLVRFPGVGAKGLQNIRAWLRGYGLDLKNVPAPATAAEISAAGANGKTQRIARAIALLRKQGFVVRPSRVPTNSG